MVRVFNFQHHKIILLFAYFYKNQALILKQKVNFNNKKIKKKQEPSFCETSEPKESLFVLIKLQQEIQVPEEIHQIPQFSVLNDSQSPSTCFKSCYLHLMTVYS